MTPNTDGIVQDTSIQDINDADQYSILLCLKEISFLLVILFFGFSGFSFCVKKVYEPKSSHKIDDIIIHDMDLVDIHSTHNGVNNSLSLTD